METMKTLGALIAAHRAVLGRHPVPEEVLRLGGLLDTLEGLREPQFVEHQDPRVPRMSIPRLRAIPFPDPTPWAWVPRFEAATSVIREELDRLLRAQVKFLPYGMHSESPDEVSRVAAVEGWDAFYFRTFTDPDWRQTAVEACPRTAEVLKGLPIVGEAFFSILRPGKRISPHTDPTNFILPVHLPLYVPEGCSITVAGQMRHWTVGQCLALDSSFVHEARNDGDQLRVTLNIDVWHPELTPLEIRFLGPFIRELFPMLAAEMIAQPTA
jgi:aspartyl/asparaginyl beta-hydroxylase (cupin superfamily)